MLIKQCLEGGRMNEIAEGVRISVRFLHPYSASSDTCSGVRMVRFGVAEHVSAEAKGKLLLYPYTNKELSTADKPLAMNHGIDLIDGPWEALEAKSRELEHQGAELRCLPACLEPLNSYYRRENPKHFFADYRFSTAEATIYALALLGFVDYGRSVALRLDMTEFYRLNVERLVSAGYLDADDKRIVE